MVATVGCVVSVNIYILRDIRQSEQGQTPLHICLEFLIKI